MKRELPGFSGMGTDIYGRRESEYLEMGREDWGEDQHDGAG